MRKRKRWVALAAVLALMVSAAPVQADPPEVVEEPVIFIFPDLEYGLAVFWNTTRADFCAWEDGGFVGPVPLEELVEISFKETGKGAMVASFQAERVLEIWNLDADADLSGPCTDTDSQAGPLAVGTARVEANDNDVFVSGTRVNAFGDRGQGVATGADGSIWHYSWTFLAQVDQSDEFQVITDRSNLHRRGQ